MSKEVEKILNEVQPVRRDFLKRVLGAGALAAIALPASSMLVATEASGQAKAPTAKSPTPKAPPKPPTTKK